MLTLLLKLCGYYLLMLKFFYSTIVYFISYARALFTAIYVYWLGFYYFLYEFYEDCQTGLKTVNNDSLFQDKLAEWKKTITKLRRAQEEEDENMENKKLVAVITGADGTIGTEILRYLLSLDFIVFAVGANPPSFFPNDNVRFIQCDLSARNEVFEAIESIQLGCDQVDLLILNAAIFLYPGFGWFPYRRDLLGENIIERHLAINVLANAQIFASLTARLESSLLKNPTAIFVSSATAHAGDISLIFKDEERFWCRHLNGYKAYADSKLLLNAYVKYLGRILKKRESDISVASLHPGVVPGGLYRHIFWPFRFFINNILAPFMRTPRQAATFILELAFSQQQNQLDGAYYENGRPEILKTIEDPEEIWMVGKSIRDMIVDNDGSQPSFTTSEIPNGGTFYESIEDKIFDDNAPSSSSTLFTPMANKLID